MYEVFHSGFSFPRDYENLKTALLVYDKEVQWTLGAILYRTRFLPLRYGHMSRVQETRQVKSRKPTDLLISKSFLLYILS